MGTVFDGRTWPRWCDELEAVCTEPRDILAVRPPRFVAILSSSFERYGFIGSWIFTRTSDELQVFAHLSRLIGC